MASIDNIVREKACLKTPLYLDPFAILFSFLEAKYYFSPNIFISTSNSVQVIVRIRCVPLCHLDGAATFLATILGGQVVVAKIGSAAIRIHGRKKRIALVYWVHGRAE